MLIAFLSGAGAVAGVGGLVSMVTGLCLALLGLRLLPDAHPRHDFAVGAFRTTLLLAALPLLLSLLVLFAGGG